MARHRHSRGLCPSRIKPPGQSNEPAEDLISPDALALVRFGLRAADDPRILNTVKVIDAVLKVQASSRAVLVPLQRRWLR